MKKSTTKSNRTERTAVPLLQKDKDGNAILLCPFCKPTHPLIPNVAALCGTMLSLTATQIVFRAKYNKDMTCVKCGKSDGMMVVFQNGFIHINDCSPGTVAMTEPPVYSKIAEFIYKMKAGRARTALEKMFGKPMIVEEIEPSGKKTGVILGHFFPKRKS